MVRGAPGSARRRKMATCASSHVALHRLRYVSPTSTSSSSKHVRLGRASRFAWIAAASGGKGGNPRDDPPTGSGGSKTDWDAAWRSFKKRSGLSDPGGYVSTPPQFQKDYSSPQDAKRQIRQGEKLVLNTWTSEEFSKMGLGVVVSLLILFTTVIGPLPNEDGRCTLPWCDQTPPVWKVNPSLTRAE